MRQTLVIMVKEPRPGRVKTRLAQGLGAGGQIAAARWFRLQAQALIRRLRDARWQIVLAVSPDHAGLCSAVWPRDLPRRAQGRGDLGVRMARQLRQAPPGRVCLIGADIPGISRPHIARAFAALGPAEAVFGPACDGGFWLIGLARAGHVPAGLFRDVRWSTRHALSDTLATLPGRRVALTDRLRDVDTAEDLQAIRGQPHPFGMTRQRPRARRRT